MRILLQVSLHSSSEEVPLSYNGIQPDHIKRHARESQKHSYTVLLVPRVSTLVTRILEEEGVLGDVTLASYNLQFIPLADDVISLEYDDAFKEIWVVGVHLSHLASGPELRGLTGW